MVRSEASAGIGSAQRAFDFVRRALARDDKLLATTKDGKTHLNADLDDYVFLIEAGLELLQARWQSEDLAFIKALANTVLDEFEDENHGAFFFTGESHEHLVYRPKPIGDDAIPSGNGVAAYVLARLGHVLGDLHYLKAAERTVEALYSNIESYPSAHGALLRALDELLSPTETIVLRGDDSTLTSWRTRAQQHFSPWRLALAIPNNGVGLQGLLAERAAKDTAVAYLCSGRSCQEPIVRYEELEDALSGNEVKAAVALH